MKQRIFALWLLVAAATAAAFANNRVWLDGVEGQPGSAITVSVMLDSDAPAAGLQLALDLPEGTAYDPAGTAACGRAAAMKASGGVRDGRLTVMLYSLGADVIPAGSGRVATFVLQLDNAPVIAPLAPTAVMAMADGSNAEISTTAASLIIHGATIAIPARELSLGRVALGEPRTVSVNVSNTGSETLRLDAITGSSDFSLPQPVEIAAGASAGVTLDYTPSVRGVNDALLRFAGNIDCSREPIIVHNEGFGRNEVSLLADPARGGEETTVSINLKNYDPICGFTIRVGLPRGFTYVPGSFAITAERNDSHGITSSATVDNDDRSTLTLTAYSFSNKAFKGTDGVVATFHVLVESRNGTTLSLDKAVLPTLLDGKVTDVVSATSSTYLSVTSPNFNISRSQMIGRTPITATESGSMSFYNSGNAPLVITEIECAPEVEVATELPMTIDPWWSASIDFRRTDKARGQLTDCIKIHSNDPEAPVLAVDLTMDRYAPNELQLSAEESYGGEKIDIAVALDNYDAVEGLQFDLVYSPDLAGTITGTASARAKGFKVSATEVEPGRSRVIIYSLGSAIAPGSGKAFDLVLTPAGEPAEGEYFFVAENILLADRDMSNLHSAMVESTASSAVTAILLGDVNKDKNINITDVSTLIAHAINPNSASIAIKIGDINGDGKINITDVSELIYKAINFQK